MFEGSVTKIEGVSHLDKEKKNDKNHKIALRYRKWIIEALIALMKEYPYEEITIKQITVQADISRQTFYRHFKSKEEIIRLYSDDLCEEIVEEFGKLQEKNIETIFQCYFQFWYEHKEILNLVKQSNCEHFLIDHYNSVMMDTLDILREFIPHYAENQFILLKAFLVGGLFNMKMLWQEKGYQESTEELAKLTAELLKNK